MPSTPIENATKPSIFAKSAPYLWAAFVALCANVFRVVPWWHPACDTVGNGPSDFAWGFPLPYRQLTLVSSLQSQYLPGVLALNVLVTTFSVFILLRPLWRELAKRSKTGPVALAVVGGALLVLTGGVTALAMNAFDREGTSLTLDASDSYWSYRPWPVARFGGHRYCSY